MIEVNHNKTPLIRSLGYFDTSMISKNIKQLKDSDWDRPEYFEANYNKGKHLALHQTQHIIFKFANKQHQEIQYFELPIWTEWEPLLLPLMEKITEVYGYAHGFFPKVMLAKLPASSFIPPHVDGNERGYAPHKVHLPIHTNTECHFFLDGNRYQLEAGQAYEINNGLKHSVINKGNTDRIHLIFEYIDVNIQSEELKKSINNYFELHRNTQKMNSGE